MFSASGVQMEIKWLRNALLNLDQELNYIAQSDPAAARMIMQRIHQAISQLIDNRRQVTPAESPARVNWLYKKRVTSFPIAFVRELTPSKFFVCFTAAANHQKTGNGTPTTQPAHRTTHIYLNALRTIIASSADSQCRSVEGQALF